jgi:hypothetical protein
VPNWQAYLVVVDRGPGAPFPSPTPAAGAAPAAQPPPAEPSAGSRQRVSVVWNGDGEPRRVALPRRSEQAVLVDKYGRLAPLEQEGDRWILVLPAASAHSPLDPEGYYFIGGAPLLLIEQGVAPDAPVQPPVVLG